MKDKKHLIFIGVILLMVFSGFLTVRYFFVPKSFGLLGHYRAEALNDELGGNPVYQGVKACGECHDNIFETHQKDIHYNVPCENCHGPGQKHIQFMEGGANITEKEAKMPKEYTLEGCLFCHRKLNSRPADFPQIDVKEHFAFLHVTDQSVQCTACHSPHEPLFLSRDVKKQRKHPKIQSCKSCHNTQPARDASNVPNHPVIFECKDCHRRIVEDFNTRSHAKKIECTTCHLFHKETESVIRILNYGTEKFCLMCHEAKPFKNPKMPPKINWQQHIKDNDIALDNKEKLTCIQCHEENIHKTNLSTGD